MDISLITSSHSTFDDRIYYHMGISLLNHGHNVQIISSYKNNQGEPVHGIKIDSFDGNTISKLDKIKVFQEKLNNFNPSIIICSEPITVFAAKKYNKNNFAKIIYDITEFYPSKKNLRPHNFFTKWLHLFKYLFFYLYALKLSDSFIFGEHYKSIIPSILFPRKPFKFISYFPRKNLFQKNKIKPINSPINLCYSGPISIEKGFINFANVIETINNNSPSIKIKIKIIGDYVKKDEKTCEKSLKKLKKHNEIKYFKHQELFKYLNLIKDTDIFIDLRNNDIENKHCLPIKLFYYMAFKRPVVYSNLKSIPKLLDISTFGHLVSPKSSTQIASIILNYIKNPKIYLSHCKEAEKQFNQKYNWDIIENDLMDFLKTLNCEK